MKLKLGAFCVFAFAAFAASAFNVSNKTVMVDQRGNLNAEGIASVQDVATNAVKAQVAEAKAEAAMTTARGVTDAIQGVVGNIMSNNVVVYRSGFILKKFRVRQGADGLWQITKAFTTAKDSTEHVLAEVINYGYWDVPLNNR